MLRQPILSTCIRSSIGAAYRRISRLRSATSMSHQADGSGSRISTAMFFVQSASLACVAQNAETNRLAKYPLSGVSRHLSDLSLRLLVTQSGHSPSPFQNGSLSRYDVSS